MSEDDDRRVEARVDLSHRGLAGSKEHIERLRERLAQSEKMTRRKPLKEFAQVMQEANDPPPTAGSPKATAPAEPPTPAPGLRRPGERDDYGVVRPMRVILKG